jgi:hypothetical protein
VAQLKLKDQYRRKTDELQVSTKNYQVYTRDQLLVTGFLEEEINISSIIGHHGLVAKKNQALFELQEL